MYYCQSRMLAKKILIKKFELQVNTNRNIKDTKCKLRNKLPRPLLHLSFLKNRLIFLTHFIHKLYIERKLILWNSVGMQYCNTALVQAVSHYILYTISAQLANHLLEKTENFDGWGINIYILTLIFIFFFCNFYL